MVKRTTVSKTIKALTKRKNLIEKIGEKEYNRRQKQRQSNKKNPKTKKTIRQQRELQVRFLTEVRLAKTNGTLQDILIEFEQEHGKDIVETLIKRCNISHWI